MRDPKFLTKSKTSPKYFISAPFGNYIKHHNAISTTGSWTLHPRGNRLWSVIKTLRYDFSKGCWVNRLGLPNSGIRVGLEKTLLTEVLSVAETERGEFEKIARLIPDQQNIEVNLSCPNLGSAAKVLPWDGSKVFNVYRTEDREWCIAKLSPLTSPKELEYVIENLGFRQLHFSNTFPHPKGAMSGSVLRPYTIELIRMVREVWGNDIEIIAGGGVDSFRAVYEYLEEGADHVAIGSVCFNYFKMKKLLEK